MAGRLNPDEIERDIRQQGVLDLQLFPIVATAEEILGCFRGSELLQQAGLGDEIARLRLSGSCVDFSSVPVNSYFASVVADFLRGKLLEQGISFTFETVMSSMDKVELLGKAQRQGFRTYLYYVATIDPDINIERIRSRVHLGGHPVPDEKVRSRYRRSLDNLVAAIRHSNRAYLFDNSASEPELLVEFSEGRVHAVAPHVPGWFKEWVWDRLSAQERAGG